jgi:MFS family permease
VSDSPSAADRTVRRLLPRNVKILALTSLLNDTASEIIFPLLPTFLLTVLGGNLALLGVVEGAADSVAGLLKLWAGGWSDRVRRRKGFLILGYALAVCFRPLIGLVTAPWQVLVIRTTDRIGKGIRTSPRDALIADSTDPAVRGRAFGFHRAMDHLGAAAGPLVAAAFLWMWPGEFRTLFLLTLVPGLAVLVLLIYGLDEVPRETPASQAASEASIERFRLSLRPFNSDFRRYLLGLAIFTLGNSSDAFLLVRSAELGVPVAALPLLWCAFHVVKSLGNVVLGGAVDRFGPRRFIFGGWLVYGFVYLGLGLATTAWHAWALFLAYALFYGLTEPAEKRLVVDLAGPEQKGLAFGWFHFAIGVTTLPASVSFGALYQVYGSLAAFGFGAGLAVVAAILLASVRQRPSAD